ncbi:MAG TPA: hypothetical protein VGS21_01910, partial [Acidimicrobiales bacterium]|nr:hypothetical protein [Acidimicrobiales bacterium]
MTTEDGPPEEPTRGVPLTVDPVAAASRRRRRSIASVASLLAALVIAAAAVAGIVHVWGSTPAATHTSGTTTTLAHQQHGPRPVRGGEALASQLGTGLSVVDSLHAYSVATVPVLGGGFARWLAATADGGATWALQGTAIPGTSAVDGIDVAGPHAAYVWGAGGLQVSFDDGTTWSTAPIDGDVEQAAADGSSVWALVSDCSAAASPPSATPCPVSIDESADGGHSWLQTGAYIPVTDSSKGGAALHRIDADTAYLVTWGSVTGGLAMTINGGTTWTQVGDPCAPTPRQPTPPGTTTTTTPTTTTGTTSTTT